MHETVVSSKLNELAQREAIRVLFAVESGSRAWGFPSPDSDFDVRFVYCHKLEWYLYPKKQKDTIDFVVDDRLDFSGWDIRKCVDLTLSGNSTVREWLVSPVIYEWTPFATVLKNDIIGKLPNRHMALYHYTRSMLGTLNKYFGGEEVSYKKYLYVIRPALVLRWLRFNVSGLPPMNLQALVKETIPAHADERHAIMDLVKKKKASSELGQGPRITILDQLAQTELQLAQEQIKDLGEGSRDLVASSVIQSAYELTAETILRSCL